ncbi:hypothetical protein J7J84_00875 [bacterium]|nr:hypothetical protein [bacterium]
MMWAKIGGYGGATVGMLGWLIGLLIVAAKADAPQIAWQVAPAGVLLTLALAALLVITLESVIERFGAASLWFQVALWGLVTTCMGLLMLLLNHWVAPLIDRTPGLQRLLAEPGSLYQSTYRTADAVPVALLAAGFVLLGAVAWRMLASAKR